jgi:hypothetical protein
MNYPKDHLQIHKEASVNSGILTHYLVNTYYDYALTFYFETRKQAQDWVNDQIWWNNYRQQQKDLEAAE